MINVREKVLQEMEETYMPQDNTPAIITQRTESVDLLVSVAERVGIRDFNKLREVMKTSPEYVIRLMERISKYSS